MLMNAWRAAKAVAVAERDLAKQEMLIELLPLLARGWPPTTQPSWPLRTLAASVFCFLAPADEVQR
jgi:hypothetical protein